MCLLYPDGTVERHVGGVRQGASCQNAHHRLWRQEKRKPPGSGPPYSCLVLSYGFFAVFSGPHSVSFYCRPWPSRSFRPKCPGPCCRTRLVFEKKPVFFQTMFFIVEKKTFFLSRFCFFLVFFSKISFKWVYFTFKKCLSLIIGSGSQLKAKTKYVYQY